MPPNKPSRYALHCLKWKDGCGDEHCDGAIKRTFYRGRTVTKGVIPCDILFVGEAPGTRENILGLPFVGPAGELLDKIVRASIPVGSICPECNEPCFKCPSGITCKNGHGGMLPQEQFVKGYTVGFTNIVACIPRLDGEDKIEPEPDQIKACKPRLEEIIDICSPKLIFAVGSQARDALTQGYLHSTKIPKGVAVVHIVHPAWILRQSVAFQGLEMQKCICDIQDAIRQLEQPKLVASKTAINKLKRGPDSYQEETRKRIADKVRFDTQPENYDIMPERPTWDEDDIPF